MPKLNDANALYRGTSTVSAAYVGSTKVWPATAPPTDPIPSIPNLTGRWRADQITGLSNGAAVASWPDTSGNAYTASQATGGSQPTWIASGLNGQPVVRFAGSQYLEAQPAPAGSAAETVIAVVTTPPDTNPYSIRGANSNGSLELRIYQLKSEVLAQAVAGIGVSTTTLTASTPAIVTATYTSGSSYAHYVNGAAAGSASTAQTVTAAYTNIGSANAGAESYKGDIAELLQWSRVLTTTELSSVHTYLGSRYGITVT